MFAEEWLPLGADTVLLIVGMLGAKAYQKKGE
jgi:indole-3-glycerol phosphate synthase